MPRNNQITGNVGMYYVSYHLSKLKLDVIPTARKNIQHLIARLSSWRV